jgi:hypothetical protein
MSITLCPSDEIEMIDLTGDPEPKKALTKVQVNFHIVEDTKS